MKPIIVSMGSAARAAVITLPKPATRIYANPLSITGSIGIFYGKADVAELLRKIGVSVEVFKTAPKADAESIFRPFTPEEHVELEQKVAQFYDMFLSRVATGRKLTKSQVDAVGQGRVWTGEQALNRKLVDEMGGLRQALAEARRLAGIDEDAPIVELPPESNFLGVLTARQLARERGHRCFRSSLYDIARALAPIAVQAADKPQANIEFLTVE